MVELKKLLDHCNELLQVDRYNDYAPNGLQIEGKSEVSKIVTGVTASQALIDAALDAGADALLVHHGFFWKGEAPNITGLKRNRIAALIKRDVSLIAYHLPLDGHDVLGNNAQLASILDIAVTGRFGRNAKDELAMYGELNTPMSVDAFAKHIEDRLGRKPLCLLGEGDSIQKVAWCTGAAQSYIDAAYQLGVDAFISGEVSENTTHFAAESGLHYFAAGHHATERYGVKALGEYLENKFDVTHQFIDVSNPV